MRSNTYQTTGLNVCHSALTSWLRSAVASVQQDSRADDSLRNRRKASGAIALALERAKLKK
jgi:hypothetical protein